MSLVPPSEGKTERNTERTAERTPARTPARPLSFYSKPIGRELVDVLLLQRVVKRDRDAFETLYRVYVRRLTRFLERVTRRPLEVEEVLDDTMMVVWDKAATFSGHSKVSTWIFSIAYRKALKALRGLDQPVECNDSDGPPSENGPEGPLMRVELRRILERSLARLSPEQRAVVELVFFHGCAYGEIAQIVGCPIGTVKTRMFYALRRLRAMLATVKEDLA
jgi:RNA polymerase sigma factor (sigma-70 family)